MSVSWWRSPPCQRWVNIDRFNAAFGIGSAGFSDGMVCVPPDRPDPEPSSVGVAGPAAKAGGTAIFS